MQAFSMNVFFLCIYFVCLPKYPTPTSRRGSVTLNCGTAVFSHFHANQQLLLISQLLGSQDGPWVHLRGHLPQVPGPPVKVALHLHTVRTQLGELCGNYVMMGDSQVTNQTLVPVPMCSSPRGRASRPGLTGL